ncbi:NmrA-like family-domain-containing protein [Dactylonectria estremocensis]|uniref:NmrA-like family-domain-containing protein n=1 Tax=Dactylonectria estremocensis TaxID=1079267 RepID=A0A9P9IA83_9HYPO|nr:NmrA-like family-domain-containing protein [Dactylonectria estremocensis]
MASPHVALVGATGNLGPAILQQLLAASLRTTVLTRIGSAHKIPVSVGSNTLEVREIDYSSQSSLVSALDTIDVVISTLGFTNLFTLQKNLIDASLDAGVSRFIPSEFGNDSANPLVRQLPIFADKIKTQEYLEAKVAQNPSFSYTMCYNNSFLDWQLQVGFMVNLKDHTATLYDGGDVPFSATRLSTIGKAVVAVIENLDVTKNTHLYFHDTAVTQKQLIEIAKRVDGKEWSTDIASTLELEKNAHRSLNSSNPAEVANASLGFIARACWGAGYGGDFSKKINNKLLGIPQMSSEDLERLIREIMISDVK